MAVPVAAALLARAVPITSVVSARRGCTAAGSRIRVRAQRVQRARLGRTSRVWAPRLRMAGGVVSPPCEGAAAPGVRAADLAFA